MVDFSAIRRTTLIGRALRRTLAWIPPGTVVRVLQGEMRGTKWIVGSSVHGCWLGSYERDKQSAVAQRLHPGHVFYDVGANVGFYSLLASRRVRPGGIVHAFEPLPDNVSHLRRHLALNGADDVRVHAVALADVDGMARFALGDSSSEGKLRTDGGLVVQTARMDSLVHQGLEPPDVIKMDIEGGEVAALMGARETLGTHRPVLLVATHGAEAHRCTLALLGELGYRVESLAGGPPQSDELVATRLKC